MIIEEVGGNTLETPPSEDDLDNDDVEIEEEEEYVEQDG